MPTVYVRSSGDNSPPGPAVANPFGIGLRVVSRAEILTNPNQQYIGRRTIFLDVAQFERISYAEALADSAADVADSRVELVGAVTSTIAAEVPPLWNRDP